MLKEDDAYRNVLLAASAFMENEAFNICVGLTKLVMVYTGRDADGKETCRILSFHVTYQTLVNKW